MNSEGWIPTQADWLQDPHAPNQGTGGQPTCDGHNEPDAVRATATQLCSTWTSVSAPWSVQWPQPHPASPGHTASQNRAHHFWAHTSSPLDTHCACHHCPLSPRLNLAGTADALTRMVTQQPLVTSHPVTRFSAAGPLLLRGPQETQAQIQHPQAAAPLLLIQAAT